MGYESRIIVVNVRRDETWTFAEQIADVKMGKMGSPSWLKLFDQEIDYTLFIDSDDEDTDQDRYGDHMKYCPIEKVIAWLEKKMPGSDYRRLPVLYGLLKGFDPAQWDSLEVVHYGY